MPAIEEIIEKLTPKQVTDAFDSAEKRYGNWLTRMDCALRKPSNMTANSVHVKLWRFLAEKNRGENLKSYKYLVLSELTGYTAQSDKEAAAFIQAVKNALPSAQKQYCRLLEGKFCMVDAYFLIQQGADVNTAKEFCGDTILHQMIDHLYINRMKDFDYYYSLMTQLVKDHGADINSENKIGLTPLDVVLFGNKDGVYLELIIALLKLGAKGNSKTILELFNDHPNHPTYKVAMTLIFQERQKKQGKPAKPPTEEQQAMLEEKVTAIYKL
ncbi:MAG: hypothetical protein EPO11_05125 [Gammaproteobacteria bacterium]|nr:MAG: hypothetical protein EPO11_05125 [Gammaproteobacteria bacterium]